MTTLPLMAWIPTLAPTTMTTMMTTTTMTMTMTPMTHLVIISSCAQRSLQLWVFSDVEALGQQGMLL
jgi:hypothetical protein